MRILVTGSRNWPYGKDSVGSALDFVAASGCPDATLYIRHGMCDEGPDLAAHLWAEAHPIINGLVYVVEEIYRAPWQNMGKSAGYWRNDRMVKDGGIDLCIAFLALCIKQGCPDPKPHFSHGTRHCADLAEQAGILVWRYHV